MTVTTVFRADPSNVGDWYCAPQRYFDLPGPSYDILDIGAHMLRGAVVLGGGGLVAETFRLHLELLAMARPRLTSLVAWGIGENLNVDRKGGFVLPYRGTWPAVLGDFDLVGLRDYGTPYRWVPCASCMLPQFDGPVPEPVHEIVVYDHRRMSVTIDGFARRSNEGSDIDAVLQFLASGETVITNSYHGAYWAILLGRRVVAIPNMSKIYRLKHAPVVGRAEDWRRLVDLTTAYPEALAECRAENLAFHADVKALHGG